MKARYHPLDIGLFVIWALTTALLAGHVWRVWTPVSHYVVLVVVIT